MGGIDAIVFTAGVGENDGSMRKKICNQLAFLGIALNEEANSKRGSEQLISTADSNVAVLVIPTNEELAIARETNSIVQ
jgi:acetate kinase